MLFEIAEIAIIKIRTHQNRRENFNKEIIRAVVCRHIERRLK
jgi:hypothetical protein